jgi:hypothetical protein
VTALSDSHGGGFTSSVFLPSFLAGKIRDKVPNSAGSGGRQEEALRSLGSVWQSQGMIGSRT